MKVKDIPISDITIKERFRRELGSLTSLSESIAEKGLIQPITVDIHLNLVAGARRHAAAKMAGLEKIPCVIRDIESELDAREIELFENLHRKEMEWQEQIRLTARIHNLMKEKHGDNWTQLKTSKLLGKSRAAVTDAVELAEAMDVIPELEESSTSASPLKEEEVNVERLKRLAGKSLEDKYYKKGIGKTGTIKIDSELGLLDCIVAPCVFRCPIHQDVPEYIDYISRKDYKSALEAILKKNPLPHITGYICDHKCVEKCVRWDYDSPLNIR
ncbi:hypothetical protein LCGC14_2994500, partial [marine sediment metagenome]